MHFALLYHLPFSGIGFGGCGFGGGGGYNFCRSGLKTTGGSGLSTTGGAGLSTTGGATLASWGLSTGSGSGTGSTSYITGTTFSALPDEAKTAPTTAPIITKPKMPPMTFLEFPCLTSNC